MPSKRPTPYLVALTSAVGLLAIVAGGFFGALAMMLYGDGELSAFRHAPAPFWLGPTLGSVGGLLTSLSWSALMWRWSPRWIEAARLPSCVGAGAGLGIACGLLSTLLLHGGLQLTVGRFYVDGTIIGLVFGLPAGLVVGFLGALLWAAALTAARRHRARPPGSD